MADTVIEAPSVLGLGRQAHPAPLLLGLGT